MQLISYSFYKGAKKIEEVTYLPIEISFNERLSGYGYNLDSASDKIILFFGGSKYISYNSVAKYGGVFSDPFLAADYYGSQKSIGKMNLKTMEQTAVDLYDWTVETYPSRKIVVIGHSYGSGMAAYLASVRRCDALILLAAYRDLSDLYNKIIPIFWGPAKLFITNNIEISKFAKNVNCKSFIIGSTADKTLGADLQRKVSTYFTGSDLKIFDSIKHENYLLSEQVISYIKMCLN
ncbi:alpha/beta hydrolase [Erysipelothrix sp. HDW6C]|nr:alpha/beta hydrolase [Erysipelothrix sp. HDW6C]